MGPTDVFPDDDFDLLLLETALDNKSPAAVDGTVGTQFGEKVLRHVLLGTLHTFADVGNVGKDGLPVAFTHALGRGDLVGFRAAEGVVGVLLGKLAEEALEKEVVGDGLGLVVGPDTGALVHVAVLVVLRLGRFVLIMNLELLELGGELIVLGNLLDLLLLLLFHREVKTSVLASGIILSTLGTLNLLLLLLLLQERKVKAAILNGSSIVSSIGGFRVDVSVSKCAQGSRQRRRTWRVGLGRILFLLWCGDHGD